MFKRLFRRDTLQKRLFFIGLLSIYSTSVQIYPMQHGLESRTSDYIVRTVAFGASASTAAVSLGIGSLGLFCAHSGATARYHVDSLSHVLGSFISIPAMLIGSLATYSALLALGIKHRPAYKISGTIFGASMLFNAETHHIASRREPSYECSFMRLLTGIIGFTTLVTCFGKE